MNGTTPTHLVLVGLMGSGKSTVGRLCATQLGRPFVDTDELVERMSGQTIASLFSAGEPEFRAWEARAVGAAVSEPEPHVIACGGGAVLDPANRARLREHGVVVWLQATPESLAERVGSGSGRPLLAADGGTDPVVRLRELSESRRNSYDAAATIVIETDGLTPEDVATAVLRAARIT